MIAGDRAAAGAVTGAQLGLRGCSNGRHLRGSSLRRRVLSKSRVALLAAALIGLQLAFIYLPVMQRLLHDIEAHERDNDAASAKLQTQGAKRTPEGTTSGNAIRA
ncbi:MAG TPA: hypothetical protein VFA81_05630 [Burkholderiales bacterium]|nr:hypothetical protein [Burkholderiales bacterium]